MKAWYLRFDAAAWIASTQMMSAAECGAHINLLAWSWLNGTIPNVPMEVLCRLSGGDEVATRSILDTKWERTGLGWTNRRLEEERTRCADRSHSAQASSGKRWRNANAMRTHDDQQCERMSIQDANASDSQCERNASHSQSYSQSQSQSDGKTDTLAQRARRRAANGIQWAHDDGWSNITDEYRVRIARDYPSIILDVELGRAHGWLLDNPTRARKKNWQAFITRWCARAADRPTATTRRGSDY